MSKSVGDIRKATADDAEYMVEHARDQDRAEILASHGPMAYSALRAAVAGHDTSVIEIDGKPACMFGVVPMTLITGGGVPWLVSTDAMLDHVKTLLPRSKEWVDEKIAEYGYLQNYVDDRNTVSKRWLKWLGFQLHEPEPYGVNKLPFRRFSMGER